MQVEEVVEVGELSPEAIHLQNIFVDRIIVGKNFEKRIEVRIWQPCLMLLV